MQILLVSHNDQHHNFFLNLAQILSRSVQVSCATFAPIGRNNFKNNWNLEIEKYWPEADAYEHKFKRILIDYPDFDWQSVVRSDRNITFFPKYLKIKNFSLKEIKSYIVACFCAFEDLLSKLSCNIIISELIIGLRDHILYLVSKRFNVKYAGMRGSKLSDGIVFCDPLTEEPLNNNKKMLELDSEYNLNVTSKDFDFANFHIDQINKQYKAPDYMAETARNAKIFDFQLFMRFLQIIKNRLFFRKVRKIYNLTIFEAILYWIVRKFNIISMRYYFKKSLFDNFDDVSICEYVIFPLQFEPEATALVRAAPYDDQIVFLLMLARLLPRDIKLVVKEHKGNEGYRRPSDYIRLKREPNIHLIDRNFDPKKLIDKCRAVVTLNSRLGWEAVLIGKPVYCLGRSFWMDCPGAIRVAGIDELVEKITHSRSSKNSGSKVDKIKFIAVYSSLTFPGIFRTKSSKFYSQENVECVAESLLNFVASSDFSC